MRQRNEIVRDVLLAHPTWTSAAVFRAVAPLIAAAGIAPISYENLAHQLPRMRRELGIAVTWGGLSPEHTKFLRDQLAIDPNQSAAVVWGKFSAKWGPDADKYHRVTRWWYNTRFRSRCPTALPPVTKGVQSTNVEVADDTEVQSTQVGVSSRSGVQSARAGVSGADDEVQSALDVVDRKSSLDLPIDWWNLDAFRDVTLTPESDKERDTVDSTTIAPMHVATTQDDPSGDWSNEFGMATAAASPVPTVEGWWTDGANGPSLVTEVDHRKYNPRTGRHPALFERDAIVRSLLVAHPTWTSVELFKAATPLIAAAGQKPMGFDLFRFQVTSIAKELKIQRARGRLSDVHEKFLRDEFVRDPTQYGTELWMKFCSAFGPNAEQAHRITRWSTNTLAYARRRRGLVGPPGRWQVSPDPMELPTTATADTGPSSVADAAGDQLGHAVITQADESSDSWILDDDLDKWLTSSLDDWANQMDAILSA